MPRRAKGVRLWLRPARADGSRPAAWIIRDGDRQHGTGLGPHASEREKEDALKAYLTQKHVETVSTGLRDPSQIPIADVLSKYYTDKIAPKLKYFEAGEMQPNGKPAKQARWIQIDGGAGAVESRLRVLALREFWCTDKIYLLSHVNGDRCDEYAATRTPGAARRELEDFRAAINYHRQHGLHDKIVSVFLPEKGDASQDYLTREEAAAVIRSAWRYREKQNHRATDRATRKHVARFMVVARYMGSRAGVICEASIEAKRPPDRAWIDLRDGMLYGLPKGRKQTKKRRQLVKVPPALLGHLRRWRKAGQRYAVEWNGEPIAKVRKAHDSTVYDCRKLLKRHVSPHIWRHTVATWLMQAGGDPFKIAGFLAMSLATLLRVYGHHHPDHSADVHEAIRKKKNAA